MIIIIIYPPWLFFLRSEIRSDFPDRSYSESALSALRLLPHHESQPSSSRRKAAGSLHATPSPTLPSAHQILTDAALHVTRRLSTSSATGSPHPPGGSPTMAPLSAPTMAEGEKRRGRAAEGERQNGRATDGERRGGRAAGVGSLMGPPSEDPPTKRSRRRSSSRGRTNPDSLSAAR